jgi:hypothetical protein
VSDLAGGWSVVLTKRKDSCNTRGMSKTAVPEETVVPVATGKAKALETFLAGGGGVVKNGGDRNPQFRYQEGKLKGKTREQALSVFESMWSGASPKIKDKYAAMTGADEMLSPSEKEEYRGTGDNPQPGVAYGGPSVNVSGRGTGSNPAPAGTITPPATTTATATTAPAVASSTPASMQKGSPSFVGPPAPATATPTRRPDRMVSDRQPSELSRMAGKVFNGIRGVLGMEQKPEAPARVPDGREEGTPVRINRLTGLPFGYRPGDALPTGADGKMKRMASESVARQTEASAKAGMAAKPMTPVGGMTSPGKNFTGITKGAAQSPMANDPDILKKDDAAYKAYQAGFGGASDKDFTELKGAQQKIYDGASSLDKAKLVGNTLKRSGGQMAADREANTPKVGNITNLPNGGKSTIVGIRPAEGMGKPYAPQGGMDQNRRKSIGRR